MEKHGSNFYTYIHTLEKTKSVEKCLNSISLNHLEQLQDIDKEDIEAAKSNTNHTTEHNFVTSHKYMWGMLYLSNAGSIKPTILNLHNKIKAKFEELSKEYKQFDDKTKKQLIQHIQKGKFIDATIELEKIFETTAPVPRRSLWDCLNSYVNLGGTLGCESIQRELREMATRISKEKTGEIHVDLHADTYRQLRNIIKQIQKKFKDKNSVLGRDTTVYRGISRDGLLTLLKQNGINIKKEDFTIDNVTSKIKGKVFTDKGFMSTSLDRGIAESFVNRSLKNVINEANDQSVLGAIFEIELKKGTPIIDINKELNTTQFAQEKEILLPDRTKIKIESAIKYDFYYYGERPGLCIKAHVIK